MIEILEIVGDIAPECEITSPIGKQSWIIKMLDFVDNKRHYVNFLQQEFAKTLIDVMKHR